ncbi:O-phospho-L-seryl-tRNA:Cys-tRNA synthase [Candidatus Woesearchaeota archaeon]|nr:O-phospho-L-seryl-tRNA:Cys-tRNA synthase [Candidatus Woesearchaeota archaeon]
MDLKKYESLKRENRDLINLNPLQTGGKLTESAKKVLVEFGDGYSICDFCAGALDKIQNPPIQDFVHKVLPEFIGADVVRITHGAREGKFAVMQAVTKPGDAIIVDGNRHYTTTVAAENAGLKVVEVKSSGYPEYKISVDGYEELIKKHNPKLILLTYPDGNYGNLPDAAKLGKIAKKHNVPYLLNCAYAIGRMPVSLKEIGADFVVGSGHKSMSSSGPIGILGVKEKWGGIVFKHSETYPQKELSLLGCTSRGLPIVTLMASFPEVYKRVKNWGKEVEKAQWFSKELEKLGFKQLGEKPHKHDLMFFETEPFYEISKTHSKKGFFLYDTLKKRGITGIKPGLTKAFKLSTYGIPHASLEKVIKSFKEILGK